LHEEFLAKDERLPIKLHIIENYMCFCGGTMP